MGVFHRRTDDRRADEGNILSRGEENPSLMNSRQSLKVSRRSEGTFQRRAKALFVIADWM